MYRRHKRGQSKGRADVVEAPGGGEAEQALADSCQSAILGLAYQRLVRFPCICTGLRPVRLLVKLRPEYILTCPRVSYSTKCVVLVTICEVAVLGPKLKQT